MFVLVSACTVAFSDVNSTQYCDISQASPVTLEWAEGPGVALRMLETTKGQRQSC